MALNKWWNNHELTDTPWLHPAVVAYMDLLIQPDWRICEFGSGGSTLWFAKRAKYVLSIETNREWWEKVVEQTKHCYKSVVFLEDEGKFNKHHFTGRKDKFDLLLVDGEPVEDRGSWLDHAEEIVRPGGVVVLDNAHRPEYIEQRNALYERCNYIAASFLVNPPGHRHAITEFFRVPGGTPDECWI